MHEFNIYNVNNFWNRFVTTKNKKEKLLHLNKIKIKKKCNY